MTFIVSHNGKVYEKDLGKDSTAIGAKMTTFDPGRRLEGSGTVNASGSRRSRRQAIAGSSFGNDCAMVRANR